MHERPGQEEPPKRIQLNVKKSVTMSIKDFFTNKSLLFFDRLKISTEFLKIYQETWELSDDYKTTSEIVNHLKVVNDNAERGVALSETEYTRRFVKIHQIEFR